MKITVLNAAICSALLFSIHLQAQDSAENNDSELETITVISSRIETPLEQTATSVSILELTDIERSGLANITELLRTQTSISVSNSGGTGKTTALRIRGEEGYRTKLFLDGVELSDPSAPQVSPLFDDLLSSQIQRIEVLRGAQGLAFGADAGGVVMITSKKADEGHSAALATEYGGDNTLGLTANLAWADNNSDVFIALTDYSTDGFNTQTNDPSADLDGYENTTLHLKAASNLSQNLSLQVVLHNIDSNNKYDGCYDNATFSLINDCLSLTENTTARVSLHYENEQQNHTLGLAKTDVERGYFSGGEFSYASKGSIEKFDYVGSFPLVQGKLIVGSDIEKQVIIDSSLNRYQKSVFAEFQTTFQNTLYFNAGLRYDDNDTFGQNLSYRLGGAYNQKLNEDYSLKIKSSLGTGFRAPSLFEQNTNDTYAFGQTAKLQLREENSQGFDIGFELSKGTTQFFEVVLFKQKIENEITYDFSTFGYLQLPGNSKSKGIETTLKYSLSTSTQLAANYTYNDSTTNSGEQRLRRPRHIANLAVHQQVSEPLSLYANIRLSQDAVDIGGQTLDDYAVFNIGGKYQAWRNIAFSARIDNIFDKNYQEIFGFNTQGRRLFVGFNWTL
jgi:vitamin B12 transporter